LAKKTGQAVPSSWISEKNIKPSIFSIRALRLPTFNSLKIKEVCGSFKSQMGQAKQLKNRKNGGNINYVWN
jgi:hypothetical protein